MLLSVNSKEAVRSLLASKQRTILALIGIIIGIGSVMAMLSVGETVKAQSLAQFQLMGTDVISVSEGYIPSEEGRPTAQVVLRPEHFDRAVKYGKYIRRISPEASLWGKLRAGKAEVSGSFLGVRPVFKEVNRLDLHQGRFLAPFDGGKFYAVLGAKAAEELLAKGAKPPIEEVTLEGRPFKVIGRLAPANLGFNSDEVDRGVFIPLDLALRRTQNNGLTKITVQLWPWADHDKASAEIQDLVSRFAGRPTPLSIQSPRQLLEQMAEQMRLFTLLLAAVGSISLVVGGVGIMNMMLVSVTERRREIGIRRALGAQRGDIVSQFLVESVVLSLTGGLIGVGLGVAASLVSAHVQNMESVVPGGALLLCLGVALAVGLFFGYYPARKAANLDVIVALKAE